jgi:hypothetical protein
MLKYERNRIASQPRHDQDAYELFQRGQWHHYLCRASRGGDPLRRKRDSPQP